MLTGWCGQPKPAKGGQMLRFLQERVKSGKDISMLFRKLIRAILPYYWNLPVQRIKTGPKILDNSEGRGAEVD
jgi:hypothetical protein